MPFLWTHISQGWNGTCVTNSETFNSKAHEFEYDRIPTWNERLTQDLAYDRRNGGEFCLKIYDIMHDLSILCLISR